MILYSREGSWRDEVANEFRDVLKKKERKIQAKMRRQTKTSPHIKATIHCLLGLVQWHIFSMTHLEALRCGWPDCKTTLHPHPNNSKWHNHVCSAAKHRVTSCHCFYYISAWLAGKGLDDYQMQQLKSRTLNGNSFKSFGTMPQLPLIFQYFHAFIFHHF